MSKAIAEVLKSLLRRSDRRDRKPISFIQVELTNHCNYRCHFCPHSKTSFDRTRGFMSFDLFCRTIDEAGEISRRVNFSFFGEPMMHPEFLKCMDYLKHRDTELKVVMNTNLSYSTREIFAKLIDIGLTELRLSIDAATPETYEVVRRGEYYLKLDGTPGRGDRFETICRKAEYWFALPNHRPTRHVFTVNSVNLSDLQTYVQRWLPWLGDGDTILTKQVLTYGGKISDNMICAYPCNVWDLNVLTVDWTGQVSPCNLDTNMDLTIGSIQESSLWELSQSKRRRQIRRLSEAREIAPCRTCVDGNNWSKNTVFRKGDEWTEDCYRMHSSCGRD